MTSCLEETIFVDSICCISNVKFFVMNYISERSTKHVESQAPFAAMFHMEDSKQRMFYDFLRRMLVFNPHERATAK